MNTPTNADPERTPTDAQPCITYIVQTKDRASCIYLRDGTKVTVERDSTTKGPAWLKVSAQAVVITQATTPPAAEQEPPWVVAVQTLNCRCWTGDEMQAIVRSACIVHAEEHAAALAQERDPTPPTDRRAP